MLGTIPDVMVILPYPLHFKEEHKDTCVLDKDDYIIQKLI